MTSPFSKDYKPQIDAKDLVRPGKRSRDATASAERNGLKALPEAQPFADGVAKRCAPQKGGQ